MHPAFRSQRTLQAYLRMVALYGGTYGKNIDVNNPFLTDTHICSMLLWSMFYHWMADHV